MRSWRQEEDPEDPQEEPTEWHDTVHCPVCGSEFTRLVEMRHEAGFYMCEACGTTFEEEG